MKCQCVTSSLTRQMHSGAFWCWRHRKSARNFQNTKAFCFLPMLRERLLWYSPTGEPRARQHHLERPWTSWDREPRLRPSVSWRRIQWVLKTSSEGLGCVLYAFPHQNKSECWSGAYYWIMTTKDELAPWSPGQLQEQTLWVVPLPHPHTLCGLSFATANRQAQ